MRCVFLFSVFCFYIDRHHRWHSVASQNLQCDFFHLHRVTVGQRNAMLQHMHEYAFFFFQNCSKKQEQICAVNGWTGRMERKIYALLASTMGTHVHGECECCSARNSRAQRVKRTRIATANKRALILRGPR